jgi:hypothetical protein|tara:strand:+ start:205 stop:405 length:201 start_codon:yes stop_codon:yes gene_type:complete
MNFHISGLSTLNFLVISIIIFLIFIIINELLIIREYIDGNEIQLKNLAGDLNYNNIIISGGYAEGK